MVFKKLKSVRTFSGMKFDLFSSKLTKRQALNFRTRWKTKGFLVRIVKRKEGFAVYRSRK